MSRFVLPSSGAANPTSSSSSVDISHVDDDVIVSACQGPTVSSSSSFRMNMLYPTFPDVKLRKLPFFKVLATLMQPCSLNPSGNARYQEQKFSFYLSPIQAGDIASSTYRNGSTGRHEYKKIIQLR